MSVLLPFLLVLSAGILYFLLFLVDLSAVKGSSIYKAENIINEQNHCKVKNIPQAEQEEYIVREKEKLKTLLEQRLNVAKINDCEIKCSGSEVTVIITIAMVWPWRGLEEYLGTGLQYTSVTKSLLDKRKEWKWIKSIVE